MDRPPRITKLSEAAAAICELRTRSDYRSQRKHLTKAASQKKGEHANPRGNEKQLGMDGGLRRL